MIFLGKKNSFLAQMYLLYIILRCTYLDYFALFLVSLLITLKKE